MRRAGGVVSSFVLSHLFSLSYDFPQAPIRRAPRVESALPTTVTGPCYSSRAMFQFYAALSIGFIAAALALWTSGAPAALLPLGCSWIATILVAACLHAMRRPMPLCISEAEYAELVPALPSGATQGALYLDMIKRVLINVVYHEQSYQSVITRSRAAGRPRPTLARRFSLRERVLGEDISMNTLSMIGLRRLDNIQACVETIVAEGVPGDLIETGCAKGGACILMRAVLRVKKDRTRRVVCCDTFSGDTGGGAPSPLLAALFRPLWEALRLLSMLPSERWQRRLYGALMKMQSSFPVDVEHVTRDTIDSFLFFLQQGHRFIKPTLPSTGHSLASVRSHFARLGLLDEQVMHAHACTCMRMHAHACTCMHMCTCVCDEQVALLHCMHTCTQTHTPTCTQVVFLRGTHTYIQASSRYAYTYPYAYTHTCTQVVFLRGFFSHMHTYIHTPTCTQVVFLRGSSRIRTCTYIRPHAHRWSSSGGAHAYAHAHTHTCTCTQVVFLRGFTCTHARMHAYRWSSSGASSQRRYPRHRWSSSPSSGSMATCAYVCVYACVAPVEQLSLLRLDGDLCASIGNGSTYIHASMHRQWLHIHTCLHA